MSKKLPAQVRVHVRDLIDDPESEVQEALKSVNNTVGSGFKLELAWEDIFRDLKASFSDDVDKLVPSIGRHITIFLNRLESVLDQDEKFQDTFLENYPSLSSTFSVVVQAGSKTSCRIVDRRLTLLLPTTGEDGYKYAQSSIGTDIPKLFKDGEEEEATSGPTVSDDAEEDQEWDTVNIAPVQAKSAASKQDTRTPFKFQDTASLKPRPLPKVKTLQRPEILFSDVLPAFLTIKSNDREAFIEGSHSPTITLIGEYFKQFARKDMADANQSPRFKVEELTSSFGSGTMTDTVHIELTNRNREFRINTALFLTFIEGVCGYEMVDSKSGSYTYRRTVPF